MVRIILLLICLLLCMYFDIKFRKIPNVITMSFILVGLLLHFLFKTDSLVIQDSLLGIVIPFALLFPFFMLRSLGAGDIKQFMAIGSIMGYQFAVNAFVFTAFAALVMTVIKLVKHRNFKTRMSSFFQHLKKNFYLKEFSEYDKKYEKEGNIPFSVAIFFGVLVNYILQQAGISILM